MMAMPKLGMAFTELRTEEERIIFVSCISWIAAPALCSAVHLPFHRHIYCLFSILKYGAKRVVKPRSEDGTTKCMATSQEHAKRMRVRYCDTAGTKELIEFKKG